MGFEQSSAPANAPEDAVGLERRIEVAETGLGKLVAELGLLTKQLDGESFQKNATTAEGQAALLSVYESSRRTISRFAKGYGSLGLSAAAYAGLAALLDAPPEHMEMAVAVGLAAPVGALCAVICEQIELAGNIKQVLGGLAPNATPETLSRGI